MNVQKNNICLKYYFTSKIIYLYKLNFILFFKNKKILIKKKNIFFYFNFFNFFFSNNSLFSYFILFFEFFLKLNLKKNCFLFFNKFKINCFNNSLFLNNLKFFLKIYWILKIKIFLKIEKIFQLLLLILKYKDISLFLNWLKLTIEKIHFKYHRKFFFGLFLFFNFFFLKIFYFFWLNGIVIKIKGKINQSGNAKTRKLLFKKGNFSWTKKKIKLYYNKINFRTLSGILGMHFFLFF